MQKLGEFLPGTDEVYGNSGPKKVAKDFLAEKSSLVKTDGSNATKELATAILTIDGDTSGTSVLKEKVADKDVVKAIFNAKEQPADTQSILATKVADKDVVKAIFNAKEQPADTQSILVTKVADKDVVKAIFNTKEQPADTQSILATKVAEQAVVDVLVPALATVDTDNTKKVYTQKAVDDALNLKADASDLRDLVLEKGPSAQAVATQLLSTAKTKDDLGKAILGVTKEVDGTQQPALETDLAGNKILQDAVASNGTLKANLSKPADIAAVPALKTAVATQLLSDANKDQLGTAILGVTKKVDNVDKPVLETNLAANPGLRTAVKNALAGDGTFKSAVKVAINAEEIREVMSQPVFEIPADDNAPLSWDW